MNNLFIILSLGTIMGSFLYCLSNSRNILSRSRCDKCNHVLGVLDLIPVISFVFSKGRCRYCDSRISIMYPVSELITAFIYVLIIYRYSYSKETVMYLILSSIMIYISFKDMKEMIIPDLSVVLGITNYVVFTDKCISGIINGFLISFILLMIKLCMERIYKKEMMGFGDIKLVFMLGLYTSIYGSCIALLLSSLTGLLVALLTKQKLFPFGQCICLGYLLVFCFIR